MKVIIHCPIEAPEVPALSRKTPLVLVPFLGSHVLSHALSGLAGEGFKQVRLQAGEKTAEVLRSVGKGEAWGMKISSGLADDPDFSGARSVTLDSLPQWPDIRLWTNYSSWFKAQMGLMERLARVRVGMREQQAGVFVGLRTRIAANAQLTGPVWIGDNVYIGAGAIIGPEVVIEDDCYLDDGAEVVASIVGPGTYVGSFTELKHSFAWGCELLSLETGSLTEVQDRFLLGEARAPRFSISRLWKQWRKKTSNT